MGMRQVVNDGRLTLLHRLSEQLLPRPFRHHHDGVALLLDPLHQVRQAACTPGHEQYTDGSG